MCGLAGEIRFDRGAPSFAFMDGALTKLAPRGPDGKGVYAQGAAVLGHRRLKIIDLTEHAAQPMVDSELGLTIVYNGAIYNYPALREELKRKGYRFFSHGDTEVILKSYHAWGKECVKRFNGMFAFAIVERDSGRVVLARDRLGIKPLYYAKDGKSIRFASTLPALLDDGVDTAIDPQALNTYMSFHAVVPAPRTILQGVRKIPPGTLMTIEPDGKTSTETFWELSFDHPAEGKVTDGEWEERLEEALLAAVKRRLVADVPVGVLLSGGIDSSLVVGLLRKAGHKHVQTFSIGFDDAGGEAGNEFKYSDVIAREFETDHTRIHATHGMVHENLRACIRAMAEPMVSHDVIGFYLLSREVAKSVKVVQSGQGADEVFAGYHWYPKMMAANAPEGVEVYRRSFFDRGFAEYREAVNPDLVEEDYARRFAAGHFAKSGAASPIDKALRLDTTVMLVDDPVKRVDNMTMAWGLEARVPFLDHELVELAAQMPARLKVNGEGKKILKKVARRHIPDAVIDRPKGYFPVPALKHIEGEYFDMVNDVLHSKRARERGLFNPGYIGKLLANPRGHITPLRGSKLWQAALLELWLQEQGL